MLLVRKWKRNVGHQTPDNGLTVKKPKIKRWEDSTGISQQRMKFFATTKYLSGKEM